MIRVSKTYRKNILSDPSAHFIKYFPEATEEQLTAINKLRQQFVALQKQQNDIQKQCNLISRQIGEAKRKGEPNIQLMETMQAQSIKIKNIKTQLKNITDEIFSHFDIADEPEHKAKTPTYPPVRAHTDHAISQDQISIELLSDEVNTWNDYVESKPGTSLYHRTEWKDLLHNVFGHECYYYYASCNNEIVGILPLVRLKSWLFGDFMVSMPYFNSGGAIANSIPIEQKLIQKACNHAKFSNIKHIEFRDDIIRDGLSVYTEKVNMFLRLPGTEDDLWDTFPSKLRSQIRRAQREDIEIKIGGTENLKCFYTVFAHNMRDLGTPIYGISFFRNILKQFPERSKIVIIRLENRPVAAAFLLGFKDTLEIPWASTLKDVNHLSINMLLYWEVLKFAVRNEYQYFDFGRSSKDSGTFRFKQQWGAKPKQLYWHYWLADNVELPNLKPDNPKYALAIRLWKRLPIFITKWLGPHIVKNLP